MSPSAPSLDAQIVDLQNRVTALESEIVVDHSQATETTIGAKLSRLYVHIFGSDDN
jgi:hypothetical protein